MKKIFIYLSLILGISFSTFGFASNLSCNDLIGNWTGNVATTQGNLSNFMLNIENLTSGVRENAHVTFLDPDHGQDDYGMITIDGQCHINPDGTVSVKLKRSTLGLSSSMAIKLTSKNSLQLNAFTYKDMWDNYNQGGGTTTLNK